MSLNGGGGRANDPFLLISSQKLKSKSLSTKISMRQILHKIPTQINFLFNREKVGYDQGGYILQI